jgi:hypothetical protein
VAVDENWAVPATSPTRPRCRRVGGSYNDGSLIQVQVTSDHRHLALYKMSVTTNETMAGVEVLSAAWRGAGLGDRQGSSRRCRCEVWACRPSSVRTLASLSYGMRFVRGVLAYSGGFREASCLGVPPRAKTLNPNPTIANRHFTLNCATVCISPEVIGANSAYDRAVGRQSRWRSAPLHCGGRSAQDHGASPGWRVVFGAPRRAIADPLAAR